MQLQAIISFPARRIHVEIAFREEYEAFRSGVMAAVLEELVDDRIARLESDVAHVTSDIRDIKLDIRELRTSDIRDLRSTDAAMRDEMNKGFGTVFAAIAALRNDVTAGDAALREGLIAVRGEIKSVALETRLWMILTLGAIASSVLGFVAHALKWI